MKSKCKIRLMMLAVLFMVTIPIAAYAADGQIKIGQTPSTTFPIIIDQPGSYVLTSNIVVSTAANGIEINSDDVTLDLNGHAVIGPGWNGNGTGITASNRNNIAIMNGTVRDFPLHGVRLIGDNEHLTNIRSYRNLNYGIFVSSGIISYCTAHSNGGYGFYAAQSIITNCSAISNGSDGFHIGASNITNCEANYNGSNGIASNGCHIEGNNLRQNGKHGLYLESVYNYAIKNSASLNLSGNFYTDDPANNYMPTSLTAPDAANANVGWSELVNENETPPCRI